MLSLCNGIGRGGKIAWPPSQRRAFVECIATSKSELGVGAARTLVAAIPTAAIRYSCHAPLRRGRLRFASSFFQEFDLVSGRLSTKNAVAMWKAAEPLYGFQPLFCKLDASIEYRK
jgi:hypothetical protein